MKQIKMRVKHGSNFTARSLMYSFQNSALGRLDGAYLCSRNLETVLRLCGSYYRYDHLEIEETPKVDYVTLFLQEV